MFTSTMMWEFSQLIYQRDTLQQYCYLVTTMHEVVFLFYYRCYCFYYGEAPSSSKKGWDISD